MNQIVLIREIQVPKYSRQFVLKKPFAQRKKSFRVYPFFRNFGVKYSILNFPPYGIRAQ